MGEPLGERLFARLSRRLKDNIKMALRDVGSESYEIFVFGITDVELSNSTVTVLQTLQSGLVLSVVFLFIYSRRFSLCI